MPYDRAPRHAGRSNFNYWRLWNFALEGITSFTVMPLKVATYLGLGGRRCSPWCSAGSWWCSTLLFGNPVPGYPSLMAVILFLGGVQLVTLGVIGEYLGRVFNETKRRPLYLVQLHQPSRRTRRGRGAGVTRRGRGCCGRRWRRRACRQATRRSDTLPWTLAAPLMFFDKPQMFVVQAPPLR